jgi:DNA-binding response OmpR family regulator
MPMLPSQTQNIQIAKLLQRIAEKDEIIGTLKEKVTQLTELLIPPVHFPRCMNLTKSESKILALLYAANGNTCRYEKVIEVVWIDKEDFSNMNHVYVCIGKLKRKLKKYYVVVSNEYRNGWYISKQDREKLTQLFEIHKDCTLYCAHINEN